MIEIETRRFSTVLQFSNWKHYIYWPIFIQFLVFGWISDCGSLANAPTRATLAGFTCKSYKGPRWLFLNIHRAILNWYFYCVCVRGDSVCTTSWKPFTYGVWFFCCFPPADMRRNSTESESSLPEVKGKNASRKQVEATWCWSSIE